MVVVVTPMLYAKAVRVTGSVVRVVVSVTLLIRVNVVVEVTTGVAGA